MPTDLRDELRRWLKRWTLSAFTAHDAWTMREEVAALLDRERGAHGMRCPCGGGTTVPVPTCPACHEQWINHTTALALDAATAPHIIEERRARVRRPAAPAAAPRAGGSGDCAVCRQPLAIHKRPCEPKEP